MKCALLWSGGKDSLLALDRAQRSGLDVTHLVNIFEGNSQRVRFHGVPQELIAVQAKALGKSFLALATHPDTFEQCFLKALGQLRDLGIEGIVFGNIHLADIRAWYEERVTAHGFAHIEPLWGVPPATLIREFVARGHRSRIVSVYVGYGGQPEWLGRDFSPELIDALEAATPSVDICGERGEYHSFAWGGPLFQWELPIRAVGTFMRDEHLILDLALFPPEARVKQCSLCAAEFLCGPQHENGDCWCDREPNIMPLTTPTQACLCPQCLRQALAAQPV